MVGSYIGIYLFSEFIYTHGVSYGEYSHIWSSIIDDIERDDFRFQGSFASHTILATSYVH